MKYYLLGIWYKLKWLIFKKKIKLVNVTPKGIKSFDPITGLTIVRDEVSPEALQGFFKDRGEVIDPTTKESVQEICWLMSQAACDREFERVIVHPINGERRKEVLDTLQTEYGKIAYPMYDYWPANITNNNDLNSTTIIYKYKQSDRNKPI
jgi:hypothetical protein